jgi:hypothetical protein
MPTRKQRRRAQKERRHEYETVWVDEEGNELEAPPDDFAPPAPEKRNGAKPGAKSGTKAKARPQQRGGRSARVPPEPSWQRSIKRSVIWVVALGVLLAVLQSRSQHPSYVAIVPMIAVYLLVFPLITYYLDRMIYRRYQARTQRDARKR